jgi:hypothetical protein
MGMGGLFPLQGSPFPGDSLSFLAGGGSRGAGGAGGGGGSGGGAGGGLSWAGLPLGPMEDWLDAGEQLDGEGAGGGGTGDLRAPM